MPNHAIFSVEEVNNLVLSGTPFRDAYKEVGLEIESGQFKPNLNIHHTHVGSIGNLCNSKIVDYFTSTSDLFRFEEIHKAEQHLLA